MNNLKELRESVFKKTENDNQLKKDAFKKFEVVCGFDNEVNTTITFGDLKLFKVGERIEVNENVTFEKTFESRNKMIFLTYMLNGGTFGVHNHNCYEICKVLKGSLFEKTRGLTKVYGVGESIIYTPNEKHIPYATDDSTYEVTFYKNLP